MVSSRCVAGLSTGIRAFSAIATMMRAMSASPSDTRKPTPAARALATCDSCGEHHFLAQQPEKISVGLNDRGTLPAQEPCLDLADKSGEERGQRQHQEYLRTLDEEIEEDAHNASTTSSVMSATKTRLRYCRIVRN